DRLHLVRVEPSKVRFSVRNDAANPRTVEEWRDALGAIAVVNGSYYAMDGTPDTPLRSEGQRLGPSKYKSMHGAFVAKDGAASIVELAGTPVDDAIGGFPNAMASYPLLLDARGNVF